MNKVYYLMDSYQINPLYGDIVSNYKLEKYFNLIDGVWYTDFVGFIFIEDVVFISFPKHYYEDIKILTGEDIKLLAKLMTKTRYISGLDDKLENLSNFPLLSYVSICNYFLKHGLYSKSVKTKENNYKGRIDWNNTIRKSNKIISGGNLLFLPFVVTKNKNLDVFITECMIYVLYDGYENFGKFFKIGVNYNNKVNNPIFKKKELVIKQLNLMKSIYFKDSERLLIQNLIDYMSWKNKNSKKTILATKNFESYWEVMVEHYLNSELYNIDSNDRMIFKQNTNKFNFKKIRQAVESNKVRSKKSSNRFDVIFDHLFISNNNKAYLFDSKYYKKIKSLNYKQIAYFYILNSKLDYPKKNIINGLLLPTEKEYYKKIHLDVRDRQEPLKDLYIIEHYLNVKEVIRIYVINS